MKANAQLTDCIDEQEQVSSIDISLEHFESSFTSMKSPHASPLAPAFSPITPQRSHDSLSIFCTPTPQHVGTSSSPNPMAVQHLDQPKFVPISCSSPKPATSQKWSGFKVVLDNIDMNLKPRHQTFERRTRSIHYVNAYAVLDRVDLSNCSTLITDSEVSIASLLPTDNDRKNILDNFAVLAGRMLCQCMPVFQGIPGLETSHIHHMYSEEMSSRSEIVC